MAAMTDFTYFQLSLLMKRPNHWETFYQSAMELQDCESELVGMALADPLTSKKWKKGNSTRHEASQLGSLHIWLLFTFKQMGN